MLWHIARHQEEVNCFSDNILKILSLMSDPSMRNITYFIFFFTNQTLKFLLTHYSSQNACYVSESAVQSSF